jgi:mannose-6-phosphate isomerase-like protein (cupin superfamily)
MKLNEIFNDKRGVIRTLTEDISFEEITIFQTRAGMARGGCIHDKNDEYTCIIEGEVEYHIGDKTFILCTGESIKIPFSTPHYYISITDSVVLEWGATPEEKTQKHIGFRKIVDEINDSLDQ